MIATNFALVGIYEAKCIVAGCDAITRIPINAYTVIGATYDDTTVIAEPDLSHAWDHNAMAHPEIERPAHLGVSK